MKVAADPSPFRKSLLATTLVLMLAGPENTAVAGHPEKNAGEHPRIYSTDSIPVEEVDEWRRDLDLLVEWFEQEHPNPYWKTEEARIARSVADLREQIPRLAAHQIIVGFARILAMVGDGHTSLPLYAAEGVGFHVVPFRVGIYDDGVWVEGADRSYGDLVGEKVTAVGGVPVDEALVQISRLISRDNENWLKAVAPQLLNRIEVLHALGLAENLAGVELTVEAGDREVTRTLAPLEKPQSSVHGLPFMPEYTNDWLDARESASASKPWYQDRFGDVYGWRYDETLDLLHIKWDQVQNRSHGPSALDVFREAMAFARENEPAKTVIDIRNNTGGEGGLVPRVVREIVRTREIDQHGKIFLVIGRRTFSAGQMMTGMLEQFTEAILVGEPSSAFYNGYAGHVMKTLPHSGVTFAISPDYYQMGSYPGDPRQQATPRIAAVPTFEDYRSNRDPALVAIESYDPHAADRLSEQLSEALVDGDREGAIRIANAFDDRPENRYFDSSRVLNSLGYRFIREHELERAIEAFELNVEIHPHYANGWDSLGEAYVRAERIDDARSAFRRALELDPSLTASKEWLHRIDSGSD